MSDIRQWLGALGLTQYSDAFEANDIDLSLLPDLNDQALKDIGVASTGHRLRLLAAARAAGAKSVTVYQDDARPSHPEEPSLELVTAPFLSGERRHLTVMFCDLVGSTALSEKLDPEELRALLHDYRTRCGEVISHYEGFVARYVGDGILTYFGWPTAHEDDAERSIRAALDIVQTINQASTTEKLSVRIGIATGPVVVGEQAGVGDQSKLAIGSTPNLAARLQGLALADQIVIASSTRRLIGNAFELADLGERELKGISEPVHAWRVLEVSVAASRFEASHGEQLTPLVGREQEIGLLLDRWQLARESEGQVVLLAGEPGIGKSRIVSALRERLEAQGAKALRFQCSPYYVNSALWPSIDNFERALKFARDEPPDSKLDKLEALIASQYGRPRSDVRFIASMLSIPCEDRYGAITMTPQKFKDETLRSVVDLTETVARRHPRFMLYEDLHWADPTSLEVLDLLINRVRTIPLLIVLTHRPEFQSRWSQHGHVTSLNLSKLTRTQSVAIVSKLAGGKALPGDLLDQILAKTDGVPLYVEELTKTVLESGELQEMGERYDYAGTTHTITIPATLRDSLMERLDRSPAAKGIAQIGAAIGREFSYELIAAVASHTKTELDSALTQLTESGLAFRRGTPPDAVYSFKHALVQDAAYDSLLKTKRQELHAQIAEAIAQHFPKQVTAEPEVLARHYSQAADFTKATHYWRQAGEGAIAHFAMSEASSHFEAALDTLRHLPETIDREQQELAIQSGLGLALMWSKGPPYAATGLAFERARTLCERVGQDSDLLIILCGLWNFQIMRAEHQRAETTADELLTRSQTLESSGAQIFGHWAKAGSLVFLGRPGEAAEAARAGTRLYQPTLHRDLGVEFGHNPGPGCWDFLSFTQWMLGYAQQSRTSRERALELAHQTDHALTIGVAYVHTAVWCALQGDIEGASEYADEGVRICDEAAIPLRRAEGELVQGWVRAKRGDHEVGIEQIKNCTAIWRQFGGEIAASMWLYLLADGLRTATQIPSALVVLEEALRFAEQTDERAVDVIVYRLRGILQQTIGDYESAEKSFKLALTVARTQLARGLELLAVTSLARLWQSQGKRKEALDLLKPVYDWFTEGFDTKDLRDAKALLEELA